MRALWVCVFLFGCSKSNSQQASPDLSTAELPDLAQAAGSDGGPGITCMSPTCSGGDICLPPATCLGAQVCLVGKLLASCGDGACDCGEDSTICPADCACAAGCQTSPGKCVADGMCGNTATVCMGTQLVSSCGNGMCDCGEDSVICPADCGCQGGCVAGNACVADGACAGTAQICSGGSVGSSCGNGTCDCGEDATSCGADCGCPTATDCKDSGTCYPQGTCQPSATGMVCKAGAWTASCGDGTCSCGDTAANCAADCTACPQMGCSSAGACVKNGTCQMGTPGQICMNGSFVSSCGNGMCDCGETPASCPGDCGCRPGECAMGGTCYPVNTCMGAQVCSGGKFAASCGDKICDCGETNATCPGDCPNRCKNGACFFLNACLPAGSCEPPGTTQQSCKGGAYASSCGDGKCNCGETKASCPADCP